MRIGVAILLAPLPILGQMTVTVGPIRTIGQKADVPLILRNGFSEKIEAARATVFLLDSQGRAIAQSGKWVVGGKPGVPALIAGSTNTFHFVMDHEKPFKTTNFTAKVVFSQLVLEGGKLANPAKDVTIAYEGK